MPISSHCNIFVFVASTLNKVNFFFVAARQMQLAKLLVWQQLSPLFNVRFVVWLFFLLLLLLFLFAHAWFSFHDSKIGPTYAFILVYLLIAGVHFSFEMDTGRMIKWNDLWHFWCRQRNFYAHWIPMKSNRFIVCRHTHTHIHFIFFYKQKNVQKSNVVILYYGQDSQQPSDVCRFDATPANIQFIIIALIRSVVFFYSTFCACSLQFLSKHAKYFILTMETRWILKNRP